MGLFLSTEFQRAEGQLISAHNIENEDANICKRNLSQSFLQLQGFFKANFKAYGVNFSAAVLNYSLVPIV